MSSLADAAENRIRSRFEQSKSAILPLEAQIVLADELIDQIVFRLYGLTPEETPPNKSDWPASFGGPGRPTRMTT
jgi:hypothetical protein